MDGKPAVFAEMYHLLTAYREWRTTHRADRILFLLISLSMAPALIAMEHTLPIRATGARTRHNNFHHLHPIRRPQRHGCHGNGDQGDEDREGDDSDLAPGQRGETHVGPHFELLIGATPKCELLV